MQSGFLLISSKMAYRFFVHREHQFFLRRIHGNTSSHFADSWCCHKQQQFVCEFPLDVHILHWEIVWPNVPCVWRDFGSALRFQTCLSITKPVLPLSKEHGSQVKDQGYGSVAVISIKNFPIGIDVMEIYFPYTRHIYGNFVWHVRCDTFDTYCLYFVEHLVVCPVYEAVHTSVCLLTIQRCPLYVE